MEYYSRPPPENTTDYIFRKVMNKAKSIEKATEYLATLERGTRKPNSFGKTFTLEEIGEAYVRCSTYFPNPPLAQNLEGDGKGKGGNGKKKGTGKGKGEDTNIDIRKQGSVGHHGVMIMYKKEFEKSRKLFKSVAE